MVPGTTAAAQTRRPWLRVVVITGAAVLVTAIAAAFLLFRGAGEASRKEPPVASAYVGGAICAGCHPAEAAAWRGSHHALAMGKAGGDTVLGDFNDARVYFFLLC